MTDDEIFDAWVTLTRKRLARDYSRLPYSALVASHVRAKALYPADPSIAEIFEKAMSYRKLRETMGLL